MFLPIFSAILLIFAFNTNWYFLVFFALAPLFLFFNSEKNFWRLLLGVAISRVVFGLGAMYFVVDPLLFGASLLLYLGFPISAILIRRAAGEKIALWALPVLWTIWDYIEAQYTLLPMTIAMVGNALGNSPFLGLAKFGGAAGLTLFAALANIFVTFGWLEINGSRMKRFIYFATAILIVIAGWIVSAKALEENQRVYRNKARTMEVALVAVDKVENQLDNFAQTLPFQNKASLIVLPENLYRSNLDNEELVRAHYGQLALALKRELSAVMVTSESGKVYKSSLLFSANGRIIGNYKKHYLTITSEYWPFNSWKPFYFNPLDYPPDQRHKAVFEPRYQHSSGDPGLLNGIGYAFANPICLEFHYPSYLENLNSLNPNFFVHNSNNDWIRFGLNQYLDLTNRLRAIEAVRLQKPVLVSGIKDYAGVFYPDGNKILLYPARGAAVADVLVQF